MNGSLNRYTHLIGRTLISVLFLSSGYFKLANWSATAAQMTSSGIPAVSLALPAAVVIELGGGLLLLLGYRARLAATVLGLYLAIVTGTLHNFWAVESLQRQEQAAHLLKNLAILGGLVRLMSDGAGAISFDARRLRAEFSAQAGLR